MTKYLALLLCLAGLMSPVRGEVITIDVRNNALLLTSANAKIVGDLTAGQSYTVSVASGGVTGAMQGVMLMMHTPTQHEYRFAQIGQSFTFVPGDGPFQLAAFYVDWSTTSDNSGKITVTIEGPTVVSLELDAQSDAILLDPITPIVASLSPGESHVVSVREDQISGTPTTGAFFMYQEEGEGPAFRYVEAGEAFVFDPIGSSYQLAALNVDWSTLDDNSGRVIVDVVPRGEIERTLYLDARNALLLTPSNAKMVSDLTPGMAYTVSVASTVSSETPMKGVLLMYQEPLEHKFRYVEPGESFTFVPGSGLYQLAAFCIDWADLSDNSGTVTVTIDGPTQRQLTIDASADAILLDNIAPVQSNLIALPPRNEWVVSVRDSAISGTPVTGVFVMCLDTTAGFRFDYVEPGEAVVFRPWYPAMYQFAPLVVDWSTTDDNAGTAIVEFSGPTLVPVEENEVVRTFAVHQNFPNPFNPSTTIQYYLPTRAHVRLTVFDVVGRRVATLVDGERDAGHHEVTFDAASLPSGVYLYRMSAGDFAATKKMQLLK